jgi:hypothetical protein
MISFELSFAISLKLKSSFPCTPSDQRSSLSEDIKGNVALTERFLFGERNDGSPSGLTFNLYLLAYTLEEHHPPLADPFNPGREGLMVDFRNSMVKTHDGRG